MPKYNLYAGVNGNAEYQGTWEFENIEEATEKAFSIALERCREATPFYYITEYVDKIEL